MNLLKLERGAGGALFAGTAGRVAPAELADATLGVRPEHVVIGHAGGTEALIAGVEYLGADSLVTCRVGDQALTARIGGRVALRHGDRVQLGWAHGALHFFDGATGARRNVEMSHEAATMLV